MSLGELRPQTGLIGLYHMNGNSNDSSGSGNNCTDTSMSYPQSSGKFNQGALFGGSGKIAINTSYSNPQLWSMAGWFKVTGTVDGFVFGFNDQLTASPGGADRILYVESTTGNLTFQTFPDSFPSGISVTDGRWHHFMVSVNGTTQSVCLDGRRILTPTTAGSNYIGYWHIGNNYYAPMNGSMDEVSLWNIALPDSWARKQYSIGRFGEI